MSRRRPRGRRAARTTPDQLRRRQRSLGRWMLWLGVAIAVIVLGSALLARTGDAPESPPPTEAPAGAASATAAGGAARTTATPTASAPTDTPTPSPTPTTATTAGVDALRSDDPTSMPLVEVEEIIDGDTLDVNANGTELRVRVFGIDTPERGERCYAEAADRLESLTGNEVRLRVDERQQDRYGRELRYLYTPEGDSIDAMLVAEGLAYAWTDDGALRDALVELEAAARAADAGCLWGG